MKKKKNITNPNSLKSLKETSEERNKKREPKKKKIPLKEPHFLGADIGNGIF